MAAPLRQAMAKTAGTRHKEQHYAESESFPSFLLDAAVGPSLAQRISVDHYSQTNSDFPHNCKSRRRQIFSDLKISHRTKRYYFKVDPSVKSAK